MIKAVADLFSLGYNLLAQSDVLLNGGLLLFEGIVFGLNCRSCRLPSDIGYFSTEPLVFVLQCQYGRAVGIYYAVEFRIGGINGREGGRGIGYNVDIQSRHIGKELRDFRGLNSYVRGKLRDFTLDALDTCVEIRGIYRRAKTQCAVVVFHCLTISSSSVKSSKFAGLFASLLSS